MDLQTMLPLVQDYVRGGDLPLPGWEQGRGCDVEPLAQGEYNMNYTLAQGDRRWVFRVNVGTQIDRDDQIEYEFRALQLLDGCGVTASPHFCDDSRQRMPYGVLAMEYVTGEHLDYARDLIAAGRLFAAVHSHPVVPTQNHLIREARPLSMTYEECSRLLPVYLESALADPAVRDYMAEVLAWADQARHREAYFVADPWPCIINTEVNSSNFLVDRHSGAIHLVDWEKPLWGDPSQDLSHFRVPTTTLWKTEYRMTAADRAEMLDAYRAAVRDPHLADTIEDRVLLRDPFNCLRGISWSAMAWVSYQTGDHAIRNEDTFRKMSAYLQLDFCKSLFDPYMNGTA